MESFVVEQFPLKLPLKEIALRAVTVNLWSRIDVSALLKLMPFKLTCDEERENEKLKFIVNVLKREASDLELPNLLLDEIIRLLHPIGSEIFRWIKFHKSNLNMKCRNFFKRFVKRLIWTSAGTIDYRKTAQELVRCEIRDIMERFELACLYCLEKEISSIWEKQSEKIKSYFYNGPDVLLNPELPLEVCWAYVLREEASNLDGAPERRFENFPLFCQNAFESSALGGNRAATEYFFQKLTNDERETSLVETTKAVLAHRRVLTREPDKRFPKENLSDVLCYLLFVMTPEQRMAICSELPFEILRCFMDWPRHDHFSAFVACLSSISPKELYEKYLFFNTTNRFSCQVFPKFFPLSSADFKKYFVDRECDSGTLFLRFISFSPKSVNTVFRNVDVKDRARLVSSQNLIQHVFLYLIMDEKWELVESSLREAALPKEDWMRVKKEYAEVFDANLNLLKKNGRKREKFFEILEKMSAESPLKRNTNDESSRAKRICRN